MLCEVLTAPVDTTFCFIDVVDAIDLVVEEDVLIDDVVTDDGDLIAAVVAPTFDFMDVVDDSDLVVIEEVVLLCVVTAAGGVGGDGAGGAVMTLYVEGAAAFNAPNTVAPLGGSME